MSRENETTNNSKPTVYDALLATMPLLWMTLDTYNGEGTFKQHAFKPKISRGGNERNISLCGKIRAGNEDGKAELFEELNKRGGELINEEKACKHCLKIYRAL